MYTYQEHQKQLNDVHYLFLIYYGHIYYQIGIIYYYSGNK